MASNSFGNIFRITTWGESHGKGIGVVVDGCPAGMPLNNEDINRELSYRAPGKNQYTTSRKETDHAEIFSGVFEGKTTGAPISIIIMNIDADTSKYEPIKDLIRPGHANFTYLHKYGIYDYRGGGRSSARETACRVAAAAIAKKLLKHFSIETCAYLDDIANIKANIQEHNIFELRKLIENNPIFCPDIKAASLMMQKIEEASSVGDSLGGIVSFIATGLPIGLGDPVYEKIEANLAKAMLSLPATKGFEIGDGFNVVALSGSCNNDQLIKDADKVLFKTNHAGGTLGGISSGNPLIGRVVFKPTSSIKKVQQTVDINGETANFKLPDGSRHDPCVAIRAVPVVDAMCALVLADAILMNRCVRL